MQIFRLIQAFFLAKSFRFKSADFASIMTDDVGCSGRHQCNQCVIGPWEIWMKFYMQFSNRILVIDGWGISFEIALI